MSASRRLASLLGVVVAMTVLPVAPALAVEPLAINSGPPPSPITAHASFSHTFTATGGVEPYSFLPFGGQFPGTFVMEASGLVTGTTTDPGTFTFTVKVIDASGASAFQTSTVVVLPPTITFTSPPPPSPITAFTPFTHTFAATGGTAPYTFVLAGGVVPGGFALSGASGVMVGATPDPGSYTFIVKAVDGHGFSASEQFTIVVEAPTIVIGSPPPKVFVGQPFSHTFMATGGVGPYSFLLVSAPSFGPVTLSGAGAFTGTATDPGTFAFTVKAVDANGFSGSHAMTMVVETAPPAATTPAVTTPAVPTPAITTPAITTPAITTPAGTNPTESGSGGGLAATGGNGIPYAVLALVLIAGGVAVLVLGRRLRSQ